MIERLNVYVLYMIERLYVLYMIERLKPAMFKGYYVY